jgi:hypothetical protein
VEWARQLRGSQARGTLSQAARLTVEAERQRQVVSFVLFGPQLIGQWYGPDPGQEDPA